MSSEYDDSGETHDDYLDRQERHRAEEDAAWLRSRGYLVIPPGDASPVGELVRAAVARATNMPDPGFEDSLHYAADEAADDPAVRQWAERGRR